MATMMVESAATDPAGWTLPLKGRAGMLCLICTESAFFSIFIVAYLFYLGKDVIGPFPDQVLAVPLVATACLVSSSLTITLAVHALKQARLARFLLWWSVTILLGLEFIVATAVEWHDLIYTYNLTIRTNLFGTTYYSLVGFHAAHVIVGLILLSLVHVLCVFGRVTERHTERIEVLSWYWHFVDAVWIFVFSVVYVVGR